jgi:hypothetical protein
MAAHAEHAEHGEDVERGRRSGTTELRTSVVGLAAGVVRWIGLICALILAAHVLLTVGHANPDNGITVFFGDLADPLALAFRNLFTPANAELRVLIDYGLAALFWLIVSSVIARLIRRLS